MTDLLEYTVIAPMELPHCEETQHEHFGPCDGCNPDKVPGARGGMVPGTIEGTFVLCPVCKGTREGGPSLGMKPCDLARHTYPPGETVFLSEAKGKQLIEEGYLADPASPIPVDEEMAVRAAERFGYTVSKAS